jgi:nicotinamide phosphoribosyltransferase
MKANNLLLMTDSYKVTHWKQYPPGTQHVYSYFESRGPVQVKGAKFTWPDTTFFGLQYYLKEYLEGPVVTKEKIDEAEAIFADHFNDATLFNRAGWEHILNKHGGHLPVSIKAVPEGTVVPRLNVLMTIENTDPACYWLTNYLETLLVQVWYPTTVCTQSREIKLLMAHYMDVMGGDKSLIDFKLHDFGFRGVSSVESAGLGGCAHLVNFKGTDTLAALIVARDYYGCPNAAGFSIPAAEHSTITSWGREGEVEAYRNMLKQYPTGLVAVVSDSYDIGNACKNIWGKTLKTEVLGRNGVLIVRPDSGDPFMSVLHTLQDLEKGFGSTVNEQGFKTLNNVRIIQGDGVDYWQIVKILFHLKNKKWSIDNLAFGSGGGLLQKLNRDTLKFAFKCSAITIDGQAKPVFKQPASDKTKSSKRGRMKLVLTDPRLFYAAQPPRKKKGPPPPTPPPMTTVAEADVGDDLLHEVFRDGKILKETTLEEVRQLAWVD